MTTHVALFRGINIGGHNQVAMAELRDLLTQLRLAESRSLLQSGNLVFRSRARKPAQLEHLLEAGVAKRFGFKTDVFVRSADEWESIVALNPLVHEAERDPAHLVVMLLKDAPVLRVLAALQAGLTGPEVVRAGTRHLYVFYPSGFNRTRLTTALVEERLGTRGTARGWNTVLKLRALITG